MPDTVLQAYPKELSLGEGDFSLDRHGSAMFCTSQRNYELVRCQVQGYSCGMLRLTGMEADGFDRFGRPKFKLQEWFVRLKEK
jgi:hypothetical protein